MMATFHYQYNIIYALWCGHCQLVWAKVFGHPSVTHTHTHTHTHTQKLNFIGNFCGFKPPTWKWGRKVCVCVWILCIIVNKSIFLHSVAYYFHAARRSFLKSLREPRWLSMMSISSSDYLSDCGDGGAGSMHTTYTPPTFSDHHEWLSYCAAEVKITTQPVLVQVSYKLPKDTKRHWAGYWYLFFLLLSFCLCFWWSLLPFIFILEDFSLYIKRS
jgi:hypothetical protein